MIHKQFRKLASNQIVSCLLSIMLLGFSMSSCYRSNSGDPVVMDLHSKYSGEELFRGIFFMQGEVAKKIKVYQVNIENMNNLDKRVISKRDELADDIVSGINSMDPNFFKRFELSLKDNNFYKIQGAIQYAGEMAQSAGLKSKKFGKYFSFATKTVDKINVDDYNLSDKKDIEKFKNTLKDQIKKDASNARIGYDDDPEYPEYPEDPGVIAVAFAVVIAAVIWEVAAAVNAAVLVNFWGLAFVRTKVYASTKVYPKFLESNEITNHELFVVNISEVAKE